jgi:hypothetical protein
LPIKNNNKMNPSPKEKKSFQFFRNRTMSNSSNESNTGNIATSTSPHVSPRSFFDRVRKRSQSDAKSPQFIDHVGSNPYGLSSEGIYSHFYEQKIQKIFLFIIIKNIKSYCVSGEATIPLTTTTTNSTS